MLSAYTHYLSDFLRDSYLRHFIDLGALGSPVVRLELTGLVTASFKKLFGQCLTISEEDVALDVGAATCNIS